MEQGKSSKILLNLKEIKTMVSEELEIAMEEWLGERKAGEWELKRCLRK
jgi:hypothetical protein